eukprot:2365056-Pyramimonas_sp.AAC.1
MRPEMPFNSPPPPTPTFDALSTRCCLPAARQNAFNSRAERLPPRGRHARRILLPHHNILHEAETLLYIWRPSWRSE